MAGRDDTKFLAAGHRVARIDLEHQFRPGLIEDLDAYPRLPRTTDAVTLNSEEPVNQSRFQI